MSATAALTQREIERLKPHWCANIQKLKLKYHVHSHRKCDKIKMVTVLKKIVTVILPNPRYCLILEQFVSIFVSRKDSLEFLGSFQ